MPVEEFDAVMMHDLSYRKSRDGLPWTRSSKQKYVLMFIESPEYKFNQDTIRYFNNYINWTMTYRWEKNSFGQV